MGRNPAQIVEEQLQAIRTLHKIARHPAVIEVMKLIVQEHFGLNGNSHEKNGSAQNGNGDSIEKRGAIWDTGITERCEKVRPKLTGEITYKDLISALNHDGYSIAAKNQRSAAVRVLCKWVRTGSALEVRKGSSKIPSVFRLI